MKFAPRPAQKSLDFRSPRALKQLLSENRSFHRLSNETWRRFCMDPDLLRVLEDGSDAFWKWHVPSGRVTYNGHWAAMLGYRPGEIPDNVREWVPLVHPHDRKRVLRTVRDFCKSGA